MSFSNERAQAPAQKPNIVAVLANIVHSYQKEGVLAYEMPNEPTAAAKWFMGRMEPQQRWEGMSMKADKQGQEFWVFPYLNRMVYLLEKYYHQSDSYQAIIIGCCEESVYWRGEAIEHFYESEHSVYNEVMKMREEGIEKYQKDAVKLMKTVDFMVKKPSMAEDEPDIEF